MIPEGNWKARGGEWALGTAGTGTDQVAVEIVLLEGPAQGHRLTWYGYFNSDQNIERTVESLRLLGWKGNDLSDLSGIGTTEVYAVIAHEEYDGQLRARVKWINSMGGVALSNRFDDVQARAFGARMRGKLAALGLAVQPGPRAPHAPGGPDPSGTATDDDIPF